MDNELNEKLKKLVDIATVVLYLKIVAYGLSFLVALVFLLRR